MKYRRLILGFLISVLITGSWAGIQSAEFYRPKKDPVISQELQGLLSSSVDGSIYPVWVFFTDKGYHSRDAVRKGIDRAGADISTVAMERRKRRGTVPTTPGYRDIPVSQSYKDAVLAVSGVLKLRVTTRWFNGISVNATPGGIRAIAGLPFVREVAQVHSGIRREPGNPEIDESSTLRKPAALEYGDSYAQLDQMNAIAAHEAGYSGKGVRVLMLDTGYYKDHEAIDRSRVVAEYDFINDDTNTQSEGDETTSQNSHGTSTMSALGAAVPGKLYGPAYRCEYLLAKTEDVTQEEPVEEDYYVAGLEWGERNGADVASSSLGYIKWYDYSDMDGETPVVTRAVDRAVQLGVVVVTAAGNENGPDTDYPYIIAPADADSAISVGAVTPNGEVASFSSLGPTYDGRMKPEVSARGVGTWCALSGKPGRYGARSGTSLATPLVGGAAALILEARPGWSPMRVREALMQTAGNADQPNNRIGWGIIDVMKAINYGVLHTDTLEMVSRGFPNPFTESTVIEYNFPGEMDIGSGVSLKIYNIRGQLVESKRHMSRKGVFQWDLTRSDQRDLPTGLYFYRIRAGRATQTGKLMYIR